MKKSERMRFKTRGEKGKVKDHRQVKEPQHKGRRMPQRDRCSVEYNAKTPRKRAQPGVQNKKGNEKEAQSNPRT